MNYEDEDYVRYFTRDTVGWKALRWEGQAVLALMLHGKFDRSGVFDCDGHDPSHAVTLVTELPGDVVEVGLARLLEAKTWILRDGLLVWPKYVHAQTCRRTDRARQQESRENRRLEALGESVDAGDETSQPVTRGHGPSHAVTLSRAKPSRSEPNGFEAAEPPPKPKARRWRKFPPEFEPDETHRKLAAELGVDLAEQLTLIRDHEFKDPKSDASATLRTWLRNARKFAPPGVRRIAAPRQPDSGYSPSAHAREVT